MLSQGDIVAGRQSTIEHTVQHRLLHVCDPGHTLLLMSSVLQSWVTSNVCLSFKHDYIHSSSVCARQAQQAQLATYWSNQLSSVSTLLAHVNTSLLAGQRRELSRMDTACCRLHYQVAELMAMGISQHLLPDGFVVAPCIKHAIPQGRCAIIYGDLRTKNCQGICHF